jgi:hypothetical protein
LDVCATDYGLFEPIVSSPKSSSVRLGRLGGSGGAYRSEANRARPDRRAPEAGS